MDQEHKTGSQERDALLREILDDTSPNRPAAKPSQRPPVSHAAEEEPVPVVSHAAENSAPVSHAAPTPSPEPAAPPIDPRDADLPEPDWNIGSTQAFQTNTGGKHAAPVKTYSAAETAQLYEDLDGISQQEPAPVPLQQQKKKKKKKKRRKGRVLSALIITFAVIAVSVVVSALTMTFGRDLLGINNDTKTRIVDIPSGSNTSEIADILKEAGIISHPKVFTFFAGRSDKDGQFTAGEHELRPDMAYETIFEELASPAMNEAGTVQIAFPEGINLREAADMLESTGVCKAEEFLEFFNKNAKYGYTYESHLPSFVNEKFYPMEGYLFPDTYIFYEDMDVDLVCQKILENFNSKITPEYYERMDELNLSLDQTLTLASMIQAEAGTVDQMTKISSVFWNRLNHPNEYPKLQSDPTTNYVEEVIKPNIKKADPELYAAYDTYQSNGLPPGAICNPGMDAIRAALYPAETDYYYFYSNLDTKETYFSRTLQEHETIMEKVERTRQPAVTTKDSQEETQVVFGVGTSVATEPPTDEYGNLLTTTETQSEENGE